MSFSCSILLEDIDINCNRSTVGGIKQVALGLQSNLNIALDPNDETIVTQAELVDHVIFEHNKKDATTIFTENKSVSNGLGVITTEITVRLPALDRKMNQVDYMSRRDDLVCILFHNNGVATISGWMDGLSMNYEASSGASRSELSYVNVTLNTTSWIASLACAENRINLS